MNLWRDIEAAPPDPILGLTDAFQKEPRSPKVNLGVGVFKDDSGQTPILESVRQAERLLLERERTKSYLPIAGAAEYTAAVGRMVFGAGSSALADGRVCTAHTPGGTGALRLGAEVLRGARPGASAWVSRPTWANHRGIFEASGFQVREYPYYDPATRGLDFGGMLAALEAVPAGDVVLLHACCHNPSGVDLDPAQWAEVARVARERGWVAFLDFAYQGFGAGLEEDRLAVETLCAGGIDLFIASSYSKNFGLYNERAGALSVVAEDRAAAAVALSHLRRVARVIYSNPSAHGGLIVSTIDGDAGLTSLWRGELDAMRDRIRGLRERLVAGLAARGARMDFSFIARQNGMFSFSGLSDGQVTFLREERAIYMVKGGRMNVSGLSAANLDYVCDSIVLSLARR